MIEVAGDIEVKLRWAKGGFSCSLVQALGGHLQKALGSEERIAVGASLPRLACYRFPFFSSLSVSRISSTVRTEHSYVILPGR